MDNTVIIARNQVGAFYVIFSQASVILSTGGECMAGGVRGGGWGLGVCLARGYAWPGGMGGWGPHVAGGMHG